MYHQDLVDRLIEDDQLRSCAPELIIVSCALPVVHPFTTVASYLNMLVQGYLGIVLPTIMLMGLVLVALTVLEQLGAGLISVLLNVGYFGMILVIGGLMARHDHDPAALYWTIAIANLVGAPLVVPLAGTVIRRRAGAGIVTVTGPGRPASCGRSFRSG